MLRYAVIGGAGFIGSAVVRRLSASGHAVTCFDDLSSTGSWSNLDGEQMSEERVEGTILDIDALNDWLRGADRVIHLAALASVAESIDAPERSVRVNVEGTVNVFRAARYAGISRIVSASSAAIYGDCHTAPLAEGMERSPLSPYAASKASGEDFGFVFSHLYAMEIVSLRFFNVYGPRQSATSSYASVVPAFLGAVLSGQLPTVHGDGRQTRDFVYVDDVAEAICAASEAEGDFGGVYNIGSGLPTSVRELAEMIMEIEGLTGEPHFGPRRSGDIRHSHAAIRKAAAAFGFEPSISLRSGLEKSLEWYRVAQQEILR